VDTNVEVTPPTQRDDLIVSRRRRRCELDTTEDTVLQPLHSARIAYATAAAAAAAAASLLPTATNRDDPLQKLTSVVRSAQHYNV